MTTLVTRAMLMDPSWDARAHILDTIAKSVGTNGHAVDFVPVCDPMQPLAEKTGVRVFGPDYLLGDQPVKSIEYKYIRMASGRPDIVQ